MKILSLLLLIYLSSFSTCEQSIKKNEFTKTEKEQIDFIFKNFNNLSSPEYAIGISINGQTLYTNGYGSANLDYEIPITPNSAFDIASVSKQFTAACIALLILEKKTFTRNASLSVYPRTIKVH